MNSSWRLSPKAFNDVKSTLRTLLRGCSLGIIEAITKIVHYCEWLEARLKVVERENSELRQVKLTDIIDNPPQPFTQIREPKPWNGVTLRERLRLLDKASEEWQLCLRFNKLTHEQALALIYDE